MGSRSSAVLSLISGLCLALRIVVCEASAPAFFVFGDSLVDSGNNNFLTTSARADSPPYGVDYPTHSPTGRFSNGYNIPDFISQAIGAKESPLPYLNPQLNGQRLLIGANFASAGVGILNDTGIQFVNIIRMPLQLEYFREYQGRVSALIGSSQAKQLINQALVLITVGGNDFVNNYYLVPNSFRSLQYALKDYVPYLISEYQKLLMKLYDLGARKVLVTGTGPLGCVPAELAMRSRNGECAAELQQAASLFDPQLEQMLQRLNAKLGKNVFIAANTRQMHNNFLTNPRAYGFVSSKIACCGQGPYNGLGLCTASSNLCPNRDQYAFWDPFHPSEKANKYIAQQIMTGSTKYMKPMNLSTLLAMDNHAQ